MNPNGAHGNPINIGESMNKKSILCIIGTRPEAIKMAPVIWALQKEAWINLRVLASAQHRELLDQMLSLLEIKVDRDLDIMKPNQALPELTSRLMTEMDKVFVEEKPDLIIAQGDTTTVFVASLTSFYHQIPFAHVEAGLRTHDLYNPFPEEANRILAGQLASLHFAPTLTSKNALLKENIPENKIYLTGNTVIDTLLAMIEKKLTHDFNLDKNKKLILVTAHRRENFGKPFLDICRAIKTIADEFQDVQILYPVHPNPNVSKIANKELGNHPRIILSQPLDYMPFIALMKECYCILTDSGGIQEEAPALGKPVLVLRNETERPEAVEAGVVKLVGTDFGNIVKETKELLTNQNYYASMSKGISPYGDGKASQRIVKILKDYFQ
jgi:UDP-N-acetylglucosamine 2-epimerase (non-hydrolysing)